MTWWQPGSWPSASGTCRSTVRRATWPPPADRRGRGRRLGRGAHPGERFREDGAAGRPRPATSPAAPTPRDAHALRGARARAAWLVVDAVATPGGRCRATSAILRCPAAAAPGQRPAAVRLRTAAEQSRAGTTACGGPRTRRCGPRQRSSPGPRRRRPHPLGLYTLATRSPPRSWTGRGPGRRATAWSPAAAWRPPGAGPAGQDARETGGAAEHG